MSKKIVKKAGRPPVNIENYVAKISEFLVLGYSIKKACALANVPYRTVYDYHNKDEDIRTRLDNMINETNMHARAKIKSRISGKQYDRNANEFWLKNMDEDFKDKPTTQIGIVGNEMSITFIEDE